MMNYREYSSPLYSPEHNLQVAVGAIEYRDLVIKNLRLQIENLRCVALEHVTIESLNVAQYKKETEQ